MPTLEVETSGLSINATSSANQALNTTSSPTFVSLTLTTPPAHTLSSVAAPSLTASLTGVMMGLAGAITPVLSGKVRITISGDIANSVSGDGSNVQVRFGTGTAPVNGAALTGTTVGSLVKFIAAAAGQKVPFCIGATITGLTLNTAIWIDVGLAAVTGGNASIADVDITADELL